MQERFSRAFLSRGSHYSLAVKILKEGGNRPKRIHGGGGNRPRFTDQDFLANLFESPTDLVTLDRIPDGFSHFGSNPRRI